MQSTIRVLVLWLLCVGLWGCGSAPKAPTGFDPNASQGLTAREVSLRNALMADYDDWRRVGYRYGGQTRRGIDCSAYMQRLFRERFSVDLPRVSRAQAQLGTPVKWRDIRPGDLVFFKTQGRVIDHVGVYVDQGRMLHVSTKRGVGLTPIVGNPYWQPRFAYAKRLL